MSLQQILSDRGIESANAEASKYCLAEMSAHPDLCARLEFHGVPHRSLWRLEQPSALERHAPCLFPSVAGSEFDNWLGSVLDALPLSVVFTRLPIERLASHLRRFIKFQDDDGRYFLRLGAPAALRLYLGSIAQEASTVARWFGHQGVESLYLHDPGIALALRVQPLFEQGWNSAGREGCLVWRDALPRGA
ncbi:DUF4123 domain-containing protein [Achromobacter sp. NPDC058515]|uniref:DUF4123 domain-containing protein n=1 Tax=Achromobacter sp. NPDC058515 TaxID=3346533 RepID=UPI00365FCCBA